MKTLKMIIKIESISSFVLIFCIVTAGFNHEYFHAGIFIIALLISIALFETICWLIRRALTEELNRVLDIVSKKSKTE